MPADLPWWAWVLTMIAISAIGVLTNGALVNRRHKALGLQMTAAKEGAEADRIRAETAARRAHDHMDLAEKYATQVIASARTVAKTEEELSGARRQLGEAEATLQHARAELQRAKADVNEALGTLSLRDDEISALRQRQAECMACVTALEAQVEALREMIGALPQPLTGQGGA